MSNREQEGLARSFEMQLWAMKHDCGNMRDFREFKKALLMAEKQLSKKFKLYD